MAYNRYSSAAYHNEAADYKAKCTIAEKLGDVKLRQWCVERLGVGINGCALDFGNVDTLFKYIKGEG